jgi:hypothetical protein
MQVEASSYWMKRLGWAPGKVAQVNSEAEASRERVFRGNFMAVQAGVEWIEQSPQGQPRGADVGIPALAAAFKAADSTAAIIKIR